MERNLRQSLLISHGDFDIFLIHPISAIFIVIGIASIIISLFPQFVRKKRLIEEGDESR
jgi:TctA family transporter